MKREIKFRGWDKDKKIMRNWDFFKIQWNMLIFESDRVEIMQYTGLKDKNGKEIYEGDILWLTGNWDKSWQECVEVIWYKGVYNVFYNEEGPCNGFAVKPVIGRYSRRPTIDVIPTQHAFSNNDPLIQSESKPKPFDTENSEIEIIGNIYENPNLLTPSDIK